MKKLNTSWKSLIVLSFFSIISTLGLFISCEKESIEPLNNLQMKTDQGNPHDHLQKENICSEVLERDLLLNDNQTVGTTYIYNDPHFLYVDVYAPRDYSFKNAHLYLGELENMPTLINGDLNYKRYQYFNESSVLRKEIKFKIPLADLHKKFVVSMMVQTKSERLDEMNFSNSWIEGDGGSTWVIGRFFQHNTVYCEINNEAELKRDF
ncbi:MAG: hypothetical protein RI883_249 [Bacteroidota bacterium]|jgi:hypothetical protein